METCVRLDQVSVTLGKTKALNSIDVAIPKGQIIGLLGPSGAGKTTLMRVIIGRQRLDRGRVTVLGEPAGAASLRMQIGYMPQNTALYPDLTLEENLRYFASMHRASKHDVRALIAEVELTQQTRQLVSTLSGGQKSRASLAVALLGNPELLILDEPTVGVDPVLRQKLWQQFRKLAAQGKTLLISSHVMDEASRCDDLLLIRRGRLLAYGAPADLLRQTHTTTIEETFLSLVGAKI